MGAVRGPRWLGIGAQRSGTTWFTELLLQHPEVTLASPKEKELHALYPSLIEPWTQEHREAYQTLFDVPGQAGEFTPYYLRAPWVAPLANEVLAPGAPVIVVLRDPVDRFESAMRHMLSGNPLSRERSRRLHELRGIASDAHWGGMYATQLEAWAAVIERERILVFQYEAIRTDPRPALSFVWERLGLEPVEIRDVDRPSRTTSDRASWLPPSGLRDQLRRLYRHEVERLIPWGIEPTLWPNV